MNLHKLKHSQHFWDQTGMLWDLNWLYLESEHSTSALVVTNYEFMTLYSKFPSVKGELWQITGLCGLCPILWKIANYAQKMHKHNSTIPSCVHNIIQLLLWIKPSIGLDTTRLQRNLRTKEYIPGKWIGRQGSGQAAWLIILLVSSNTWKNIVWNFMNLDHVVHHPWWLVLPLLPVSWSLCSVLILSLVSLLCHEAVILY